MTFNAFSVDEVGAHFEKRKSRAAAILAS
jgi:hypothetical protein